MSARSIDTSETECISFYLDLLKMLKIAPAEDIPNCGCYLAYAIKNSRIIVNTRSFYVGSVHNYIYLISIYIITHTSCLIDRVLYIGDNFHIQYYDLHDETDNKLWVKSGFPTYIFILITKTMPFFHDL